MKPTNNPAIKNRGAKSHKLPSRMQIGMRYYDYDDGRINKGCIFKFASTYSDGYGFYGVGVINGSQDTFDIALGFCAGFKPIGNFAPPPPRAVKKICKLF